MCKRQENAGVLHSNSVGCMIRKSWVSIFLGLKRPTIRRGDGREICVRNAPVCYGREICVRNAPVCYVPQILIVTLYIKLSRNVIMI
jgi:hypothetical protein